MTSENLGIRVGDVWLSRDGQQISITSLASSRMKFSVAGKAPDKDGVIWYTTGGRFLGAADHPLDLVALLARVGGFPTEPDVTDPEASGEAFHAEPDVKAEIADEAKAITSGSRRGAYGTPEKNFERIALFWQAYFTATGRPVTITERDVSPMMRLMKEARLCETPDHRDSFVDLVGYTLTGAEVNGLKAKGRAEA